MTELVIVEDAVKDQRMALDLHVRRRGLLAVVVVFARLKSAEQRDHSSAYSVTRGRVDPGTHRQ